MTVVAIPIWKAISHLEISSICVYFPQTIAKRIL